MRQARLAAGRADPLSDDGQWGEWIADVERPAEHYRGRYQLRLGEARELIGPLCMPPGGDPSGGSPAPEAPDPSDVKAPKLALRITQGQRPLGRRAILLRAGCPCEACVLAASGSLQAAGQKRVYKLTSKPRRLAKGRTACSRSSCQSPSAGAEASIRGARQGIRPAHGPCRRPRRERDARSVSP